MMPRGERDEDVLLQNRVFVCGRQTFNESLLLGGGSSLDGMLPYATEPFDLL